MFESKIIIRLAGGLGNQLFQFVSAVCLAERCNISYSNIYIDTSFLSSYEVKHKYEIKFISNLFPGVRVSCRLPFFISLILRLRLSKVFDFKIGSLELVSSVEHLDKLRGEKPGSLIYVLDGYFQHPKVLFVDEDIKSVALNLISSKKSLIERVLRGLPSIGIHIRRGDYVTSKSASKVFKNIPLNYYDMALESLRTDQMVYVFSDDRELSASYAEKIGGVDVRKLNLTLEDEFCLFMACDDYVIANSTFSWWAAYLGHQLGGRIISPKEWYHDKLRSESNPLLLPHFSLIDV